MGAARENDETKNVGMVAISPGWVQYAYQFASTRARAIVMDIERSLDYEPVDRELAKLGYDIERRTPETGRFVSLT
jgi:hypothetical protein